MNQVIHGDCLETLKTLEDNSIDAVVTDPPYGLSFMGKKWDYDVPSTEIWEECLRVLKPGGYLLAFAGTRTQHRMAVRIEDAGFEIRDMIAWVYGSGFPKSLNIGKAVDKLQGNERKNLGFDKTKWRDADNYEGAKYSKMRAEDYITKATITKGTSEWEGWGTALKPALEPITVARKPIQGTVAENCLKWGVGGINIDESRVGTEEITVNNHEGYNSNSLVESTKGKWQGKQTMVNGRFPANLIHDGSEEVLELFPESTSGAKKANQENYNHDGKEFVATLGASVNEYQASSGSASRFFKECQQDKLDEIQEDTTDLEEKIAAINKLEGKRLIYQAKASKKERNMGCAELEKKAGGSNAKGYTQDVAKGIDRNAPVSNFHPTVKPIALMEYLVKLVSREGATVLDPFAGSGTTGIACKNLNRQFIGIEREADYVKIANARMANSL